MALEIKNAIILDYFNFVEGKISYKFIVCTSGSHELPTHVKIMVSGIWNVES